MYCVVSRKRATPLKPDNLLIIIRNYLHLFIINSSKKSKMVHCYLRVHQNSENRLLVNETTRKYVQFLLLQQVLAQNDLLPTSLLLVAHYAELLTVTKVLFLFFHVNNAK